MAPPKGSDERLPGKRAPNMTGLQIAPDLELPLDAVTGTFAILATKGAGKSNAAVVMAEQMYDAGIPWVAIDPKGDWFGVRSDTEGTGPGLAVPVFGGRHSDVPLEPTAGVLLADLWLTQRLSCVLDVSQFTKADVTRFLLAFGRHVFIHADDDGAEPRHMFLEEAHEYLPQRVTGDVATNVEVWQRIVKQGRFKGLGVTMNSQRSSVLNKDVLELIDTLIVLRTIGPRSRDSIKEWVKDQDVDPKLMASLPSLADGEAWVWSPGALNILQRIQFNRRRTFDSGATPKVGEKRRTMKTIADVDLAAIKEQMAETIERAKADDPKELRKRIRDLEKQLAERPTEPVEVQVPVDVEVPVLDPAIAEQLITAANLVADYSTQLRDALGAWQPPALPKTPVTGRPRLPDSHRPLPPKAPAKAAASARHEPQAQQRRPAGDGTLPGPQQKILDALAWWNTIGVTRPSRVQVAFVAGYGNIRSKGFVNPLGTLNTSGLIRYAGSGFITLTDEGAEHAQPPDAYPTPEAFQEIVFGLVSNVHTKILRPLIDAYPDPIARDDLAARTGYSNPRSKGFVNPLGRLRTLGFIEYPESGTVAATGLLFLEASDA